MPRRFCAICGKTIDDKSPHFGMCTSCYLKENPLFELPIKFNLRMCLDCYRYSKREEWIKPEEKEFLSIIKEAIYKTLLKPLDKNDVLTFSMDIDDTSLVFSSKDLITSLDMKIKGYMSDNLSISNEEIVKINISYDLCNNCVNVRGGNFFSSILQLRVKNFNYFNLIKNVLDEINEYIDKEYTDDDKQYISKITDQKNGVDVYLSTIELMNHIISYLKARYQFILKRTKKLVGRDIQKGKGIYRLKALIRFLPINKNDIIKINNQNFIVDKILKNKVILRNNKNEKLVKEFGY